jgi:hypothetical protein
MFLSSVALTKRSGKLRSVSVWRMRIRDFYLCRAYICDIAWDSVQDLISEVFLFRIAHAKVCAFAEELLRDHLRPGADFYGKISTLKWARLSLLNVGFLDLVKLYCELCCASVVSGVPTVNCELKGRAETHRLRFTIDAGEGEEVAADKSHTQLFVIIPIEKISKHSTVENMQFLLVHF